MERSITSTIVAVAAGLMVLSGSAQAVHLTTLSLGPAQVLVVPGETAAFSGSVGTNTDCGNGIISYGSSLTAVGGPAGSVLTLDPTGSPVNGPLSYNYTLDVEVPIATAPGPYPVTVNAAFDAGPPCEFGSKNASATVQVLAGKCPQGGNWFLQQALGAADPYDKNGDGYICTKDIPGEGEGNSANRAGASDVGHVDGHNHKDNNN